MGQTNTALFDVDGVSAALVEHVFAQLDMAGGKSWLPWRRRAALPPISSLAGCHDLFVRGKTILTPAQLERAFDLLKEPGFAGNCPIISGSREGIKKFQDAGFQVVWLTAPWLASPTWDYDRRRWLERHFKTKQSDVVMAQLKELVQGDLFIDDKPSNVERWLEKHPHGRGLLFDQPWNQDADPKLERFRWADTDRIIEEVLHD